MRNLLRLIVRYHFLLLFLAFEALSFIMVFNHNQFQKAGFVNFSRSVDGFLHRRLGRISNYFSLYKLNEALYRENLRLRNRVDQLEESVSAAGYPVSDTAAGRKFYYQSARVINNSVTRQYNYLTIDKGSKHGVAEEMGVIGTGGVVGVVYTVSPNFSTVISLLNRNFRLSAKIKKNDYFGSLAWTGTGYRRGLLTEIPYHVDVQTGDTVVTSGYSAIFPEGIMIGTVAGYSVREGNFYEIEVELSTGFKDLVYVYVIGNTTRAEQMELENIRNNG